MNFSCFIGILMIVSLHSIIGAKSNAEYAEPSRKWLTELFSEAENSFNMEEATDPKCRSDFRLYMSHYRNQSVWAVRMKESAEWPSVGLYSGMIDHLGNYAECLRATGPEDITGQYCLATITVKKLPIDHSDSNSYTKTEECDGEDCSAWSIFSKCAGDYVRTDRRKIQWAICLPSSCSANDLHTVLNHIMIPIFEKSDAVIDVNTDSSMCSSKVTRQKPQADYYYTRNIILGLITLVIAATVNDWIASEENMTKGWIMEIFKCFSATRSYRTLTECSAITKNPIYFYKFILMFFIIMGHRWIFAMKYPLFQTEELEEAFYSGDMFLLTALNFLDIFLLMSGFLLYHMSAEPMKRAGTPFVGVYIIFRLLKTFPVHAFTVFFVANILPYLGDGPLWNSAMTWMSKPCKAGWFHNLIGTNNMVVSEEQCLIPAWYMAIDFQSSVVGILLLLAVTKNYRFGISLMALTCVLSTIYTIILAYSMGLSGFLINGIGSTRDPFAYAQYNRFYFSIFPRLNPYLMGMSLGLVVEKLKKMKFKFSPILSICLLLLTAGMPFLVQYHGFTLLTTSHYSPLWKALFAAFHRPLFVLPFFFIGCIYFVSGIEIIDILFTHKIFYILGRLGFSVCLWSYIFQVYHMSLQRSNMPTSNHLNFYLWSIGDIVISYAIAFFVYIIVEGPFANLLKQLKLFALRLWTQKKVD